MPLLGPRLAIALVVLPFLLAGCLGETAPGSATESGGELPVDEPQEPTDPRDEGQACTPWTVSPSEARLPSAFPLLLTLRFTNCGETSVTVGTGADCDGAGGLEPRMERLSASGAFRLGLQGREDAVADELAECAPGKGARAVPPGTSVEADILWNGSLHELALACLGEPAETCGVEGQKPERRPRWSAAEPDLYILWVTERVAVGDGWSTSEHRAGLRLLPAEDPDAPCARLTMEGDRRELLVDETLALTARLENCGAAPLTLEPGGPCAANGGITVSLERREEGPRRWLLDEAGPARGPDAPACPPYVAPPRVVQPGETVEIRFAWDGTLLRADATTTRASGGFWLLSASARTTDGALFEPTDATWGVELREP
ncbi:MAG TPA: hypothetical protein VFH78_09380 [Candidatus Thermoplasmatota archaeon]|nr:hypothetical protein [Candidatus Thermoplasmatota archaeon]